MRSACDNAEADRHSLGVSTEDRVAPLSSVLRSPPERRTTDVGRRTPVLCPESGRLFLDFLDFLAVRVGRAFRVSRASLRG